MIFGQLEKEGPYLQTLASRFAIISDDLIAPLHGNRLLNSLKSYGLEAYLFTFPHGEQNKTRATKEQLENQLFEKGLGRDTCVIALGGGVVIDLVGFLAATYCRGVPLVVIPTTLLGMVDASIGGKTGVNTPYGKNLVGCNYRARKILIDTSILKSLPQKEISNGFVEMIKHGLIADLSYFEALEDERLSIEEAILGSYRIKTTISMEDELESGKRRLLNFGHTVGHALEQISNYSLSHGEAVAIGILVESHISYQLGHLDENSLHRIKQIFSKYKIPLHLPKYPIQSILDLMALDKKSLKGKPRFVIIDKIGSALPFDLNYCTAVDDSLIKTALEIS